MRSTLVLTTTLFLVCVACHKPRMCCGPGIQPGLIGNWRLIFVDRGLSGGYTVPGDSSVILTLNNDSTYHVQDRMIPAESGTFHLTDTLVAALSNTLQPVIVFSAGVTPFGTGPTVYTLSHDSLTLGTSIYDGPSTFYVKID